MPCLVDFTSIASNSLILLKKFICFNTVVPFFMHSPYNCFWLFVIYNVSNLDHKLVVISSSITLYMSSSVRHNWIMLVVFRSNYSQSSFDMPAAFADFSCKVLWRLCCTNNAFTLVCHKLKFSLPLNFSTSNFVGTSYLRHIVIRHPLALMPVVTNRYYDTNCYSQDRYLRNLTIWWY